jgi:hypothetical protein
MTDPEEGCHSVVVRVRSVLPCALSGGLFVAFAAFAAVSCGGQTTHGGGGGADASSDGTTLHEAAPGDDGGTTGVDAQAGEAGCGFLCDSGVPATSCPPAPPTPGTACVAPQTCEYGTSWFLECNVVLRCFTNTGTGNGTWTAEYDGGGCSWLDAGTCPATWDEARAVDASPGTCPFASCVYPEGFCGCGVACGGGGGAPAPHDIAGIFVCIPTQPGCPEPRPHSGTPCDGGTACNYGFACGCGQMQQCDNGAWIAEPGPACP